MGKGVKVPGKKRVGVILSNACHSSVVKFYSGRATNGMELQIRNLSRGTAFKRAVSEVAGISSDNAFKFSLAPRCPRLNDVK